MPVLEMPTFVHPSSNFTEQKRGSGNYTYFVLVCWEAATTFECIAHFRCSNAMNEKKNYVALKF